MKSFGKKNKRYLFVQLFISLMLYSCAKTSQYETKQPILDDYTLVKNGLENTKGSLQRVRFGRMERIQDK